RPRAGLAGAAEADASSRRRKALACGLHVLCESTSAQSACPYSQQTAPPPCAQVRRITLIYVENVGSQFHSLRQRPERSRFSTARARPISPVVGVVLAKTSGRR